MKFWTPALNQSFHGDGTLLLLLHSRLLLLDRVFTDFVEQPGAVVLFSTRALGARFVALPGENHIPLDHDSNL